MAARTRLVKELQELNRDASKGQSDPDITLLPDPDNITTWRAEILGPKESCYANHRFALTLRIPPSYPLLPPDVRFTRPFFHPNVHISSGEICLDILKTNWSPAWTLLSVCRSVLLLMAHPQSDSPLNCDAGNLLRAGDERGFRSMARMYSEMYGTKEKREESL